MQTTTNTTAKKPESTKQAETLTYIRIATRAKDCYDGLLYLHRWETGYQYLIFPTTEKADSFRARLK